MRKRWTAAVLGLLALVMLLTGCGKTEPDVPLETILDEIEAQLSAQDAFRLDENDLLELYGIRGEDLTDFACLTSMNGIFPDEILMLHAADEAALGRVREKLDNRLAEVLNQSKSYDPESYAIAQKCRVDVRGLYAALFVSARHEEMSELYGAHFR